MTVTREHHYDLTKFFWESSNRFLAISYVTVTAVEGDEESTAAKSNTFSFNNLKTVDTKCKQIFQECDARRTRSCLSHGESFVLSSQAL